MNPLNPTDNTQINSREDKILSMFPGATPLDWKDWRWQLKNSIADKDALHKIVDLTDEEIAGIESCGSHLKMSITPYFASRISQDDPSCPLRLQAIPRASELIKADDELEDPCGEEQFSPVPNLVHRYPDRVLFLASNNCAMYCRHCTRSRIIEQEQNNISKKVYEDIFSYIKSNRNIRDVLISGGDPLTLNDYTIDYILTNLRNIEHVEFIRIGTRTPVTLPQRITPELLSVLKEHKPIWMSLHFNHSDEITEEVKKACELLADNGIPLGSQTVLLKGINDDSATMKKLMHDLLRIRVKPYYIYQCDKIIGSKHFRTKLQVGIDIINALRGHTSGYAVPTFVIDGPNGEGKIPLSPEYVIEKQENGLLLRNFQGKQFFYGDI